MPEALERKLKQVATQRGLTGDRKDAFVYGSMRHTGWTPSHQKTKRMRTQADDNRKGAIIRRLKRGAS